MDKKATALLCLVLLIGLTAAGCGSRPDSAGVDVDENTRLEIDTGYYKIADYNVGKVPEVHTESFDKDTFTPVPGGHLVLQWDVITSFVGPIPENGKLKSPTVKCFDSEGGLIWAKAYDITYLDGGSARLAAFPDGSFVLAVEKWSYGMEPAVSDKNGYLVMCDRDGKMLWKKKVEKYEGELFHSLFITGGGDIVTAGTGRLKKESQPPDNGEMGLVFMKFDKNGDMTARKSFAGDGTRSLSAAAYSEGTGLIISYYSREGERTVQKLGCFSENFDERWTMTLQDEEYVQHDKLILSQGFIYLAGATYPGIPGTETGYFLMKIDPQGREVWKDRSKGKTITAFSLLDSGNLAVSGVEGKENYLRIIDGDNRTLYKKHGKDALAGAIYPAADGGFIGITARNIKTLPQPLFISSIWFDSEVVAAGYDKELKLLWRKTYDTYKAAITPDFVYPTRDGKLLVE